ncbi:MAG: hypothetical protein HFE63_01745 [Clostridiales bacterium]|nr:hypothetical protein [Clostridiales bacterium]
MMTDIIDRTRCERERFDEICRTVMTEEHERNGIGTLSERTLHVILKRYYEPDISLHEQKVGRYVADIKRGSPDGGEIIEIQTRGFSNLRGKLSAFLPEYRVKVVYPIAQTKYITWIDPDSGEMSNRRKSPKRGQIYDFLLELYALRPMLPLDGLSFDLVFLDIDEFKLLTGRSRDRKHFGAERCERIPTALCDILTLSSASDFLAAVPDTLGEEFTSADYAKASKLSKYIVNRALQTLVTVGVIERTGKIKNSFIYKRKVF